MATPDHKFVSPELPPWHLSPLPKNNEASATSLNYTPGQPSPLDRIKSKKDKKARALAFGLASLSFSDSFDHNQSLPNLKKATTKATLKSLVKSEKSFSYASQRTFDTDFSTLDWSHPLENSANFDHHGIVNPNKLVLCLDEQNKVLLSNNMACQLLGFKNGELQKLALDDFVLDPENGRGIEAIAETEIVADAINAKVLVAGKVVNVKNKEGKLMAMSLWLKETDQNRKLAILEPVDRLVAKIKVTFEGKLIDMDKEAERLFEVQIDGVKGKDILTFLPHIEIPQEPEALEESVKQRTIGKTRDGANFPVATKLQVERGLLDIQIWVYTNISGLVLLDSKGSIESCNPHFIKILFGQSEMDLKGKSITSLIPGFFDDLDFETSTSDEFDDFSENQENHSLMNILNMSTPQKSPRPEKYQNESFEDSFNNAEEESVFNELKHLTSTPAGVKIKSNVHLRSKVKVEFPEGRFFGFGRHKDGDEINILYQIRRVTLEDGSFMYCLWIAKDPEDSAFAKSFGTLTLANSKCSTIDESLGDSIRKAVEKRNEMRIVQLNHVKNGNESNQVMNISNLDSSYLLCKGSYNEKYCTLDQIGKGAFGYVKTAFRRSDKRLVVTKFIKRSKVFEENWVTDTILGLRVPLEISLLCTLDHPNIVRVLDVHQNEDYLQLVMEKHGAGMDLFEFLDRRPKMDEPLASYIFRQVVTAVDYLHNERNLLHRDIKDENVIINQHFQVKLIDFGSAAPIPSENWLYSTFYGTVEYCSPEVLNGNCYRGPELEMWTLGILIYVMIFNENPFYGVEETLKCELKTPFSVSPLCMEIIKKLLAKEPTERMTLQQLIKHEWITQKVEIQQYNFKDVIAHCSEEELHPKDFYSPPSPPSKSDADNLISSLVSLHPEKVESLSDSLLHILD